LDRGCGGCEDDQKVVAHGRDGRPAGNHDHYLEPSTSMRQVACLHAYVLYGQHGSALYTTSSRYGKHVCHKTHSISRGLTPISYCISPSARQSSFLFVHSSVLLSRRPRRGHPPRSRLRPAACLASWPNLARWKSLKNWTACPKWPFRLDKGLDYVAVWLCTSHKLPHECFG
jgi:hypothetical protein